MAGVNVGIVGVVLLDRVVGDILLLGFEVVFVTDAVLVISGVPDFSWKLIADCEGISALYELDAASRAHVDRGCDQYVEVVRHDGERVERESAPIAVAEESGDHELGVRGALEDSVALVGEDSDGVGALRVTDGSHAREHTPEAKTPSVLGNTASRPKAKALGYLEAGTDNDRGDMRDPKPRPFQSQSKLTTTLRLLWLEPVEETAS